MNDALPRAAVRAASRFESTVQKLFARSVKVVAIDDINPAFRILTLAGESLRGVAWTPGDKIQVQLGGWVQRTYTPLEWDADGGRTRILVCLHAGGPGAQWARSARAGDSTVLFGPRKSITLPSSPAPTIVFGDETSLGLAAAFTHHGAAPAVHVILEVAELASTLPVLTRLGIGGAQLCVRRGHDAHVPSLSASLVALLVLDARADLVLTGRAATISRLVRDLQHSGRRHTKAYWANGKAGLD
jgi:ferric-chelate reductase (NADPH)